MMLLFGHVGITVGVGAVLAGAVGKTMDGRNGHESWLVSLAHYVDIRVLMVGSMLPDIIDKPVGHFFFRDTFSNGRIFSHTLLFLVLLSVAGFWLYRSRRQVWMITLAAGSFLHLVLDQMWNAPSTLFWPLLGLEFARADLEGWFSSLFEEIVSEPVIYVSELAGLAVLLWIGVTLLRRKKLLAFIKSGKVE